MASSQASNLTGLLSGIGSTIGSMGGPGNALIDNVRTLNAPKLDQNDPASMRAYADWAMRNGDQQTAQQYQLAAGKMEQEQGARKGAVEIQQMADVLKTQQQKRQEQLANVAGDTQAENLINSQFDAAQEKLVGRMNDLSAQYGLDTTGTGALQQEQQRSSALGALREELKTASSDEAPRIRAAIAGVSSGAISPADALESIEGRGDVTNSWRTAQAYAADYNATNGLEPGDEGFMSDSQALDITTKNDAERKQEIAEASAVGSATGTQSVEDLTDAYEQVTTLTEMTTNYDRAIELLETEGAKTGAFESMLPSVRDASLELENIRNEMGLDVVGMASFGQLNESELKLALSTALPEKMDEAGLIDWLQRKKAATNSIIREMNRFRAWSGQNGGGTLEEFNRTQQPEEFRIDFSGTGSGDKENEPSGSTNDGANLGGTSGAGETKTAGGYTYTVEG